MRAENKTTLPAHTPEIEAALEAVRTLLEAVDTSTEAGTNYALTLLRERGLPDSMIFIAKHQPKVTSPDGEMRAERILRANGVIL